MIRFLLFLKRRAWPIAFAIVVCTGLILGTLFYWYPFRGAKAQVFKLERQYADKKAEKESLLKVYEMLKKKYQDVEADRDNVMVQVKQLLADKEKFLAVEDQYKKLTAEHEKLVGSHQDLKKDFAAAQAQISDLKIQLNAALSDAASTKESLARLSQEKNDLYLLSRDHPAAIQKLEEEVAQLRIFRDNFESISRSFETLKKQNKMLKKELKDLPKKFSRVTRENRILIRETGDMHYNLGVFYAKERDYSRALVEFQKAVDLDPKDAKAQYNLGYIYAEHLVDRKKAEYHFKEFLGLDPEDPNAEVVKSYLVERDVFTTKVLKS